LSKIVRREPPVAFAQPYVGIERIVTGDADAGNPMARGAMR
jgi:hypothetical protein